jgi:hypothetical protein
MAGLVPAIHVFVAMVPQDVDGRDKPGHDELSKPCISGPDGPMNRRYDP